MFSSAPTTMTLSIFPRQRRCIWMFSHGYRWLDSVVVVVMVSMYLSLLWWERRDLLLIYIWYILLLLGAIYMLFGKAIFKYFKFFCHFVWISHLHWSDSSLVYTIIVLNFIVSAYIIYTLCRSITRPSNILLPCPRSCFRG